jgi:Lipase (class 3)
LKATYISEQGRAAIVVSEQSQPIYIVFRGTDGDDGIVSDLSYNLVTYGPAGINVGIQGKVHYGFNDLLFGSSLLYKNLDAATLAAVKTYPFFQVKVVGHSLGGALSVLYGAYIATKVLPGKNIASMATGSPRVGNATFKQQVESMANFAIFRMVYKTGKYSKLSAWDTRYFVTYATEPSIQKSCIKIKVQLIVRTMFFSPLYNS